MVSSGFRAASVCLHPAVLLGSSASVVVGSNHPAPTHAYYRARDPPHPARPLPSPAKWTRPPGGSGGGEAGGMDVCS